MQFLDMTDTCRVIYTCALNQFGGCESDLTVTVIESGSGELHNPKYEVKMEYFV